MDEQNASHEEVVDEQVDGVEGQEAQGGDDPLKNFKAEFSRKLENQNKQIETLLQTLQQSRQQQQAAPAQQESDDDIDPDLIYDDPKKYAKLIEERASKKVQQQIQQQQAQQAEINQVVNQFQSQYPEFKDGNSAAYQKAIAVYSQLPPEQQNAQAAKMAFLEAVAEQGLVPVSKRKKANDTEDFTMSGKGGANNRARSKQSNEPELSEGTIAFAKALNPRKSEKELIEGLKKTAKRQNWNKWGAVDGN